MDPLLDTAPALEPSQPAEVDRPPSESAGQEPIATSMSMEVSSNMPNNEANEDASGVNKSTTGTATVPEKDDSRPKSPIIQFLWGPPPKRNLAVKSTSGIAFNRPPNSLPKAVKPETSREVKKGFDSDSDGQDEYIVIDEFKQTFSLKSSLINSLFKSRLKASEIKVMKTRAHIQMKKKEVKTNESHCEITKSQRFSTNSSQTRMQIPRFLKALRFKSKASQPLESRHQARWQIFERRLVMHKVTMR